MRSGRAVANVEKINKKAVPVEQSRKVKIVERLAANGADYLLDQILSMNAPVPPDAPIINVDGVGVHTVIPGNIEYDGTIIVTVENNDSQYRDFDIFSYLYDLDDESYQPLVGGKHQGVGLLPDKSRNWEIDYQKNLFSGRKVVVTEINGQVADVSEVIYVNG